MSELIGNEVLLGGRWAPAEGRRQAGLRPRRRPLKVRDETGTRDRTHVGAHAGALGGAALGLVVGVAAGALSPGALFGLYMAMGSVFGAVSGGVMGAVLAQPREIAPGR